MTKKKRPARFAERRAGKIVPGGTVPFTTAFPALQSNPIAPLRIVEWRVDRWLNVSRVEVRHG